MLPVRVVFDSRPSPARLIGWSYVGSAEKAFRIVLKTRVRERGATKARAVQPSELIETLAHEWAHCIAWKADHSELCDHGPAWGLAYATCYRTIIEE